MAHPMLQYVPSDSSYEPGVCNIGPAEIARRRRGGYLGLAAAVALGAVLVAVDAPAPARLLVALPIAAALSGFIQAQLKFCANYGWRGIRDRGDGGGTLTVEDADARATDRKRSARIFGASLAGGLAVALLFAALPK